MDPTFWSSLVHPQRDDSETSPRLWELCHENSKTTRYAAMPGEEEVVRRMLRMNPSLACRGLPAVALPSDLSPLSEAMRQAVLSRRSTRAFSPATIARAHLAAMLHCAYGVTAKNENNGMPRPFRATPSGGGLYPLEIYLYLRAAEGLDPGLYQFEPETNQLRVLGAEHSFAHFAHAFVQEEAILNASMLVILTAVFERTVFKYGDRGYRFALIEAGHVAQNLILAAADLGYGTLCLGGYFDHEVDELLALDGVSHSTIYALAVGGLGLPA